jgi:pimeloyl-ACP methyl ester carboxylesterase
MRSPYLIDAWRFGMHKSPKWNTHPDMHMVDLTHGTLRILDTKEGKQCLLIIPDGPNIIEHYFEIVAILRKEYRVIIFDLYGFGFSTHKGEYDYSFLKTNLMINEILDLLSIKRINLIFPCANGFYGISYANAYPDKVNQLILIQTPSLSEMSKWSDRTVPAFLKLPYLGQMIMPFVEKKFATKWYDYALPKDVDGTHYKAIALSAIEQGGHFCLCSLSQGMANQEVIDWELDDTMSVTLLYGDKDFTHKPTNFDTIRDYHKGVDIIRFTGCGHFPDLERTEHFIQIVRDKVLI